MLADAGSGSSGRRSKSLGARGTTVRAIRDGWGLHLPATILAAAERGAKLEHGMIQLQPRDLRGSVRQGSESNFIVFCVDASSSMAARDRLSAVTGAIASLLRDAYQKRDKVAVVVFRGDQAHVVLPATNSMDIAMRRLSELTTGGRTPLAEGLKTSGDLIVRQLRKEPERRPILIVLSDGRATGKGGLAESARVAEKLGADSRLASVVIDCENSRIKLGLAGELAKQLGATYVNLPDLNADSVAGVVRAYHRGYVSRKA